MPQNCLLPALWIMLITGIGAARAQDLPALQPWAPSSALLKKLGPAVSIEGYSLQPPVNYTLVKPNSTPAGGTRLRSWLGATRQDGTRPSLILNMFSAAAVHAQNQPLNQVAERILGAVRRVRRDWKQTKMESGILHGMKYVRVGWTGTMQKTNLKMQGWMVVIHDGDSLIELASQDVITSAPQALPLAEASAWTFQRALPASHK